MGARTHSKVFPAGEFRLNIEYIPIGKLRPHARNARTHSSAQIDQICESYREFGVINPVVVDAKNTIIAGHARWAAAKRLNLAEIPAVRVEHLSDAQLRAFMIADNKIASNAGWNEVLLAEEMKELIVLDPDLDLRLTGFSAPELDELLEHEVAPDPEPKDERLPGNWASNVPHSKSR